MPRKKNESKATAAVAPATADGLPPIPEATLKRLEELAKRNQVRLQSGRRLARKARFEDLCGAIDATPAEKEAFFKSLEMFE